MSDIRTIFSFLSPPPFLSTPTLPLRCRRTVLPPPAPGAGGGGGRYRYGMLVTIYAWGHTQDSLVGGGRRSKKLHTRI